MLVVILHSHLKNLSSWINCNNSSSKIRWRHLRFTSFRRFIRRQLWRRTRRWEGQWIAILGPSSACRTIWRQTILPTLRSSIEFSNWIKRNQMQQINQQLGLEKMLPYLGQAPSPRIIMQGPSPALAQKNNHRLQWIRRAVLSIHWFEVKILKSLWARKIWMKVLEALLVIRSKIIGMLGDVNSK